MLLEIIKKIIVMVIIMIIAAQNHYKNWGHDKFGCTVTKPGI